MSGSAPIGEFTFSAPVFVDFADSLFTAKAFKDARGKETGEPKFNCNLRFLPTHPDLQPLKTLMAQVAKAEWPAASLGKLKFPISNGDALAAKRQEEIANAVAKGVKAPASHDFMKGHVILVARSKFQPRLAILQGTRVIDLEGPAIQANKGQFYFGVEALCQIKLQAYNGVGANPDGVCAYINLVLSLNKGPRIGGSAPSASEVFRGYAGGVSHEDPTINPDDEIPF